MKTPPAHVLARLDDIIVGQEEAKDGGGTPPRHVLLQNCDDDDDDDVAFGIESSASSFSRRQAQGQMELPPPHVLARLSTGNWCPQRRRATGSAASAAAARLTNNIT